MYVFVISLELFQYFQNIITQSNSKIAAFEKFLKIHLIENIIDACFLLTVIKILSSLSSVTRAQTQRYVHHYPVYVRYTSSCIWLSTQNYSFQIYPFHSCCRIRASIKCNLAGSKSQIAAIIHHAIKSSSCVDFFICIYIRCLFQTYICMYACVWLDFNSRDHAPNGVFSLLS